MKTIDLSRGMVFVTGGGGSIGGAIAKEAANAGAKVAVCDFNLSAAEKFADSIGAQATAYQIDVTKKASIEQVMHQANADLGPMIGLVTAAAILRTGPVATQTEQGWHEIMSVNVDGTFLAVQAAVPYLEKTKGAVVTLGSVSAFIGSDEGAAYTTTKGAVRFQP